MVLPRIPHQRRESRPAGPAPSAPRQARRPTHVGVVMDGNRRWARAAGHANVSVGHQRGAEHVENLLGWCTEWGIDHVTVYVLSADNIGKRADAETTFLFDLLAGTIPDIMRRSGRWSMHLSGDLGLLPPATQDALIDAHSGTAGRAAHVTLAIGYDGRRDIVAGIRRALETYGPDIDPDAITASLPGGPVKEIDLVIRTSGERRLSGFCPWQTANAEIFISPKMWPAFTAADFAAAMQYYAERAR